MERPHACTQTDHEVHDVFYYKRRAYKAEIALLTLRRDQYIHQLHAKLKEIETDTSNKLTLYAYSDAKTAQLKQEFQNHTVLTEQLEMKAQEIFIFNVHALNDGHELNELPLIEDREVDLQVFRLGPVTPTISGGSRQPPLFMSNLSHGADSNTELPGGFSNLFGAGVMGDEGGTSLAMNGFPPAAPGAYIFPRSSEDNRSHTMPGFGAQAHHQGFNLPFTGQTNPIGSNRPVLPPTIQFNELDIQNMRGEEILRMISIDGSTSNHQFDSNRHINGQQTSSSSQPGAGGTTMSSSTKPPDVIPKTVSAGRVNPSPPSNIVNPQSELSMGLDHLDYDYSSQKKSGHQKWSQIAAGSNDSMLPESDWQAVGSKKARPQPISVTRPMNNVFSVTTTPEHGANFEQMVVAVQEKYTLTRPEVIAVLQGVRNERNGDMNISLADLMKDAERLLTKNKNILKPASLTARARAVPDHAEPCENQLCPARLKLLKYRTEQCLSFQTTGKCHMKPGSCVYAHGESEQRPLPKEELCERYLDGKCNNRRCVYAHGASELKNRLMVNPIEYLKSKQRKLAQDTNKSAAVSEDYTLIESDLDPRGDECSICLERMSRKSRRKLDCGHDAFHYKCLKKWVAGEGDRSCPLCRSNTLLPEEYPRLGSH